MSAILIKCPNSDCNFTFGTKFHENDQIIVCSSCKTEILFLNSSDFNCPKCKSGLIIPLNVFEPLIQCGNCNSKYRIKNSSNSVYKISKIPMEFAKVSYCGNDYFTNSIDKVEIANAAFNKIRNIDSIDMI